MPIFFCEVRKVFTLSLALGRPETIGPQGRTLRPGASPVPPNVLEIQILGTHPMLPESELWGILTRPPSDACATIICDPLVLIVMLNWVCVGSDFADDFYLAFLSDMEVILKDTNVCT